MSVIELLQKPWPWYVGGPLITLTMFLLIYFGKSFGVSSNLRTMCSIGGGNKLSSFFDFDWRGQIWNLIFVAGSITGGYISSEFLMNDEPMKISETIITELNICGIGIPEKGYLPEEIFSFEALFSLRGFIMLIIGGFLVGFGARYAGGCTSGHAISGLSNLQIPSLIAVVGFFIGGLIMTYLLLPFILNL